MDTTPPTAGHVYDGDKTMMTGNIKDIDYQTETKVLHAYWKGFHESHSTIRDFYVSVGTCPQCEDILPEQAIGITNGTIIHVLYAKIVWFAIRRSNIINNRCSISLFTEN